MPHTTPSFPLLPILLLAFLSSASAHSFLLSPRGDFKSFKKPECRIGGPPHQPNDNCPGPCIPEDTTQFDPAHSTTTFRRGQFTVIRWARNNHRGGFVRLTLVPLDLRMSFAAHRELAFHHTCFETGVYNCTGQCGTDRSSLAYSARVQIPTAYPDGLYVLGWVWYGGTVSAMSYMGDYYSCAAVRIRGGSKLASYEPIFEPGNTPRHTHGTCNSAVNRVGKCRREPCRGLEARDIVPRSFKNGRRPLPIEPFWFGGAYPQPSASPSPSLSMDTAPALAPTTTPTPTPTSTAIHKPSAPPSSSNNTHDDNDALDATLAPTAELEPFPDPLC